MYGYYNNNDSRERERERESYDDLFLISPKVAFDKMGCFIFIELLREKIEESFPRGVSLRPVTPL